MLFPPGIHPAALVRRKLADGTGRELGPEGQRILTAIFDVAQQFPDGRLPEVFAGHQRSAGTRPIPYPETCSPQAWAAGALPYMLSSSLGLEPDAPVGRLRIVRPALPAFLGEVTLRGLRVGEGAVDLRWRRQGERTLVRVLDWQGELRVEVDGTPSSGSQPRPATG